MNRWGLSPGNWGAAAEAQLRSSCPHPRSLGMVSPAPVAPVRKRLSDYRPPDWLVPGQTVDVNLILSRQQPHLVLPLTSVLLRGDSAQVVLLNDGVVSLRTVEVSTPTEDGYLIRSGLDKDDLVARFPIVSISCRRSRCVTPSSRTQSPQ